MNIFEKIFTDKQVFVGYITAGHGGIEYTQQAAIALAEGGVDILEIGIPFSDPVADGPVIQQAMHDALQAKIKTQDIFRAVRNIKQRTQIPIVLFTYYNPLLAMGLDTALQQAAEAGVAGILVVDLPLEESTTYFKKCSQYNLQPVCLLSPTTDEQRISAIAKQCNSFLYYVCRNGITGIKDDLPADYIDKIENIKALTKQYVVSGFGIANRELAAQALKHADGFVVGSAFVNAISNGASPADLKNLAINIDPR